MAYDIESDRIILFGGLTGAAIPANYNGETWAYDPTANKWTEMKPPSGPSPRISAQLVYDVESDRVILFGGSTYADRGPGDTWAYDYNSNTWTPMAKGPPHRVDARIAYDSESDRVVLFGGWIDDNGDVNDTWTYDFNANKWQQMSPHTSPIGRGFHFICYDSGSDRVLLFGGMARRIGGDTLWSYDYNTNTWEEIESLDPHPDGRDCHAMAYDAESDRTMMYGGCRTGTESWAYDYNTNTWTKLEPSTIPGELSHHAMAYSTAADRVVVFGGQLGPKEYRYTGETWTYDLNTNTWTNVPPLP